MESKISCRSATPDDAAGISQLSAELGYPVSVEDTIHNLAHIRMRPEERVWIAVVDGIPAGWIHVFKTVRVESGVFAEIGGMVVSGRFRRMGVGKLLVGKAIDWCRENRLPLLRVRTNIRREESQAFYSAVGFKPNKQQAVMDLKIG